MNEDFQGLCEEAEAWRELFNEPGFLWRPREKVATGSLDEAGTQKDGSKIR